ncbi:MAG: cation:proton antiporter [Chloroflexia bacterium]|nr:cation:proton antiporter [Chloroflexia bacterium]
MIHETDLIITITVAFVVASVGGYIASCLRLPPILGFILSGVAIGPFTPGFSANSEIASQLAEIGVILLMFGVGIHFSLKDLLAVQSIALPGAVIQVFVMTSLVTFIASLWGWSLEAGILLGLAISIASTVILVHTLTEREELESPQGRIAVGWLIVEDLLTVFALVLIPVLIVDTSASTTGGDNLSVIVAVTVGKVVLLAGGMILVGARVVPWILVQTARTGSRELFMLSVLSVALGIAYISASVFDVSFALGAFLAGLVISESDLSYQAAAEALPLQDAFAVLFFVSVGMLFDWTFLIESPVMVITILLLIVVVKPVVSFLIVAAYRYPMRVGLIIGASRAQIGEFSFILASLGLSLDILPVEGYSLILSGAILSITLNPLVFKAIQPIENWLRQRPPVMKYLDTRGGSSTALIAPDGEEPMRGHAVLCGYGRVGRIISQALERRGFRHVVIEQDRHVVEELRTRGITAYYGDASNPMLLKHLNLDRARVLVIAVPDPISTRLIVEEARLLNPRLAIVVRTHSETERERLAAMGVNEAVVGEMELALEMTRFTMRRFGVGSTEIQALLQGLRVGPERATEDQEV